MSYITCPQLHRNLDIALALLLSASTLCCISNTAERRRMRRWGQNRGQRIRIDQSGSKRLRHEPLQFRILWGRWDRNRTCSLRFWSLLPSVQQRSGAYTSRLEVAHFDGPKYQDVH